MQLCPAEYAGICHVKQVSFSGYLFVAHYISENTNNKSPKSPFCQTPAGLSAFPTPRLRKKIPVFSDPAPGKS